MLNTREGSAKHKASSTGHMLLDPRGKAFNCWDGSEKASWRVRHLSLEGAMGLHQRGRSRHRVMGAGTEGIPGRGDDMGRGLEVKEGSARVGCTLAVVEAV